MKRVPFVQGPPPLQVLQTWRRRLLPQRSLFSSGLVAARLAGSVFQERLPILKYAVLSWRHAGWLFSEFLRRRRTGRMLFVIVPLQYSVHGDADTKAWQCASHGGGGTSSFIDSQSNIIHPLPPIRWTWKHVCRVPCQQDFRLLYSTVASHQPCAIPKYAKKCSRPDL